MSCNPKIEASIGALELISDLDRRGGIRVVGLGSGSTVKEFIRIAAGKGFFEEKLLVASSLDTALLVKELGYNVVDARVVSDIDVYVDGADAVDGECNMVKGKGAAMLGEKILASASKMNIFIVGEDKLVEDLPDAGYVPVEIVPMALSTVLSLLDSMGFKVRLRSSSGKLGPIVSDWGGVIADVEIKDVARTIKVDELNAMLSTIPGIVETGLFVGLADYVVVGYSGCGWRIVRCERKLKKRG